MRDKVVGTYSLWKGDQPLPQGKQEPRIALSQDGTFSITGISTDEGWNFGLPSAPYQDISGNWSVGDDGDGSWAVFFDTSYVNGRQIRRRLIGRPTLQPRPGMTVTTDHGGISFDRTSD